MFQLTESQTLTIIKQVKAIKAEKLLILVRGLPGLGKSTLGRQICEAYDGIQLENDMQFMVSGEYVFDASKLEDVHQATQTEVKLLMTESAPCVVVSNTFTRFWEMQPYETMADELDYTLIVVDLLLAIKLNYLEGTTFKNLPAVQLLEFLSTANVHSVPSDKLRSMYDRYEYDSEVVTVQHPRTASPEEEITNATLLDGDKDLSLKLGDPRNAFKLLDTGYYLALDLVVPDGSSLSHSTIYQRCIEASQMILQVFGLNCGYRMIRKLTVRNAKSHGMCYAMEAQARLTQQACTNPHANARSAVKLAAGWTRYHVTLLSPTEYKELARVEKYEQFLALLKQVDFRPLVNSFTVPLNSVGIHKGEIVDTPAFPLDRLGELAGLSEKGHSTSVYLLLDPDNASLRDISCIREQFGFAGLPASGMVSASSTADLENVASCRIDDTTAAPSEAAQSSLFAAANSWQPHITLAFSHNDVRAVETAPATWDKALGIRAFEELIRCTVPVSGGGADTNNAEPATCGTDLTSDTPRFTLATLMLYGEVQVSFKDDQFGFVVADLKVRKGAMGDDATYRAHPFLQSYLPRGMVYLQHMQQRAIYRGLFSLRKFYGKEGVEDDGIGIAATQMNFKLGKVLENTESILVMEKVNGRAASARFFRYDGQLYVIVGTKLSHCVCWVDIPNQCLVSPAAASAQGSIENQTDSTDEECEQSEGLDGAAAEIPDTPTVSARAAPLGLGEVPSQDLIRSNRIALQNTLQWDKLDALVSWLDGRTLNGEVLDPLEMHLVSLTRHEWVSLCVTDFVLCGGGGGAQLANESAEVGSADTSALRNMQYLGEFTKHVPAYESHSTLDIVGDFATVREAKRSVLARITAQIVHARDSEGKVLYFLDGHGRVLELLKYKTWWYIWRRSIREVTNPVFSRFYNKSHRGQSNERDQDDIESERLAGDIERLQKISLQMAMANPAAQKSEKYRNRLDEVHSKLNQLHSQVSKIESRRAGADQDYDVTFTVMELIGKVQRKWPAKFSFFQAELGDRYEEIVARVIDTAVKFLRWVKEQFQTLRDPFYIEFKQVFPVVWDRFLVEAQLDDVF